MDNLPRKIRLAIVGCGKMGLIHKKAAQQLIGGAHEQYYKGGVGKVLQRLCLDSLVDPSFLRTGKDRENIFRFRTHEELLRKRPIDAAVIAAPTVTHRALAGDFLTRGIPLLIEKPVAEKTAEILEIKKLAEDAGVFVLPGHVERYNPVTIDIAETLKYKVYGKVTNYSFVRTSPRPERIPDSIIIDKLIHDVDLLLRFFGKPKVEAAKFSRDKQGIVIECDLSLRHRSGVTGRVFSSWKVNRKERSIAIDAERGRIEADFTNKTLFVKRLNEFPKAITGYGNNQVKDQLADFFAGIFRLVPPLVNIDDAVKSARLIDRIASLAAAEKSC
jgi:predicted dehydrogenase